MLSLMLLLVLQQLFLVPYSDEDDETSDDDSDIEMGPFVDSSTSEHPKNGYSNMSFDATDIPDHADSQTIIQTSGDVATDDIEIVVVSSTSDHPTRVNSIMSQRINGYRTKSSDAIDQPDHAASPTSETRPKVNRTRRKRKNKEGGSKELLAAVAALLATLSFVVAYEPSAIFKEVPGDPTPNKLFAVKDIILFFVRSTTNNKPPIIFYILVLASFIHTVSIGVIQYLILKYLRHRYAAIMTFLASLAILAVFVIVVKIETPTFSASIGSSINISSVWLVWVFVAFPFFLIKLVRCSYKYCCSHSHSN